MAGLNRVKNPKFDGEERYTVGLTYIDKIFPLLPDFSDFTIIELVRDAKWQGEDLENVAELQDLLRDLLVDKFRFAQRSQQFDSMICLTNEGRNEKKRRLTSSENTILGSRKFQRTSEINSTDINLPITGSSQSSTNPAEQQRFDFPTLSLTEIEKKYLNILYRNLITSSAPTDSPSLTELWNGDLPKEFDPSKMNQLLVGSGRNITLWGIYHLDPESKYLKLFDETIWTIRIILSDNPKLTSVTSDQIFSRNPDISISEIWRVSELMQPFQTFLTGHGGSLDLGYTILLESNSVLNQYRLYPGLQVFLSKYLERQGIKSDQEPDKSQQVYISAELYKTPVKRASHKEIEPVMGVLALAEDLGEIIHDLPSEKGQMIGVFGKWGRGKTFLLNRLWTTLKAKEDTEYIRVEYHAWKYQETPASWAYLYELLADSYLGSKKGKAWFCHYSRLLRLNWVRLGWLPFGSIIATSISCVIIAWVAYKKLDAVYSPAIGSALVAILIGVFRKSKKEFSTEASALVKKYVQRQSYKPTMGLQADIQDELIKLLKVWVPYRKTADTNIEPPTGKKTQNNSVKKILLIVEDIDRCTEDKIIQNIDALRVMLEEEEIAKRLLVITAIDERILKNAIRIKYQSILKNSRVDKKKNVEEHAQAASSMNIEALVSEYLDKVFIMAVKLGNLTNSQKDEYVLQLLRPHMEKYEWEAILKNPRFRTGLPPIHIVVTDEYSSQKSEIANERNRENILKSTINPPIITGEGGNANVNFERLTGEEAQLFRNLVETWADSTPRRIGILYYRYLLTKNLLINKYSNENEANAWSTKDGLYAMMRLILNLGNTYDSDKILEERNRISKNDDWEQMQIHDNFSIRKRHYLILLEILELTIAY